MKLYTNLLDGAGVGAPPARGRGLKPRLEAGGILILGSPPARGRGLKRVRVQSDGPGSRRPPRGGVD